MITENDKLTLKGLDIKAVAERLGLEVKQRGNSRCFNTSEHRKLLGYYLSKVPK